MKKIIYTDKHSFDKTLDKIKKEWNEKIHILADFDKTLTKAFSNGKKRSSLISVLRDEWYLSEEYRKKAQKLFDYYNPIEIDPNINIEEKSKQMTIWWRKHLKLLIESWLSKSDIENIIKSKLIELRPWVINFLKEITEKQIELLIISANWLWTDSIKMFFEKEDLLSKNINIISNSFKWSEKWEAIWYNKRVIHTFNKWETVLKDFPEIHKKIKNRKNVILLWDSLWDPHMIDGFGYDNLIKIWFLNDKEELLLEEYQKRYDLVLTWDHDAEILNDLLK